MLRMMWSCGQVDLKLELTNAPFRVASLVLVEAHPAPRPTHHSLPLAQDHVFLPRIPSLPRSLVLVLSSPSLLSSTHLILVSFYFPSPIP